MKYLCLVYQEDGAKVAPAGIPGDACTAEPSDDLERLCQSGCLLASSPRQPAASATTVRVRNGTVTITAGSSVEQNQHLGGYYVIEARDLNQAIRLAAKLPLARLGSVEVRPLQ